jgi:hypothetical protein
MPRPQFRLRSLFVWTATFAIGIAAGQRVVPAVRARFWPVREVRMGIYRVEGWKPPAPSTRTAPMPEEGNQFIRRRRADGTGYLRDAVMAVQSR